MDPTLSPPPTSSLLSHTGPGSRQKGKSSGGYGPNSQSQGRDQEQIQHLRGLWSNCSQSETWRWKLWINAGHIQVAVVKKTTDAFHKPIRWPCENTPCCFVVWFHHMLWSYFLHRGRQSDGWRLRRSHASVDRCQPRSDNEDTDFLWPGDVRQWSSQANPSRLDWKSADWRLLLECWCKTFLPRLPLWLWRKLLAHGPEQRCLCLKKKKKHSHNVRHLTRGDPRHKEPQGFPSCFSEWKEPQQAQRATVTHSHSTPRFAAQPSALPLSHPPNHCHDWAT